MQANANRVDLAIVGGGPTGLAVAIHARLAGLTATVFDRSRPPIDRACGEGLMPDAWKLLQRMGVEVLRDSRASFAGIRYLDGPILAEGRFPGSPGIGIRRTVLHEALCERARDLGVELCWGQRVTGLAEGGVEVEGRIRKARCIVGADGRRSKVRAWAGLDGGSPPRSRFAMRQHFTIEPWTDLVEVHWGAACEAYVTPVAGNLVGVAFLWSGGSASFEDFLQRFPALQDRLGSAPAASRVRGAGPLEERARGVVNGSVVLVGDASGFVDAIAGEGLALAFRQARAFIEAFREDRLEDYEIEHRRILRGPTTMTRLLLGLDRLPSLRRRVLRALAADPELFDSLLSLHARESTTRDLGVGFLMRFALRMATA